MKQIITLILFAAPFIVSAQEPTKSTKTTKTPPSSEKSISEKGVSSTKGRGINTKKPAPVQESQPAPAANTATATTNEKPKQ